MANKELTTWTDEELLASLTRCNDAEMDDFGADTPYAELADQIVDEINRRRSA